MGFLPPVFQELITSTKEGSAEWKKYGADVKRELTAAAATAEAAATKMEADAAKAASGAEAAANKAAAAAEKVATRSKAATERAVAQAEAAATSLDAAYARTETLMQSNTATAAELDAAVKAETVAMEKLQVAAARADTVMAEGAAATSKAMASAAAVAEKGEAVAAQAKAAAVSARATAAEASAAVEGSAVKARMSLTGLQKGANTALLGTGIALAGVGYESIKMAGDFQSATTLLKTGAGETEANLGMVSKGMLDMSGQVGVGSEELAKAMYLVESSGKHGAAGLEVLRASAQGAKTDGADVTEVANALTTVLADMGPHALSAATTMSQMVAAVGQGKMKMNDLAGSIHSVLPNAAALGIGFDQVGGALAAMTAQGMSADQAAQNLNHVIVSMANPTAVMTKTMAAYGVSSLDVSKNLGKRGLTGTLDLLYGAVMKQSKGGLAMQSAFMANRVAAEGLLTMYAKLPPEVKKLADEYTKGEITGEQYSKQMQGMPQDAAVLGMQFKKSSDNAAGFSQALRSGKGSLQTMTGALAQMTGGQTGLQVAMHLTGENAKTFNDNVKKIGGTTADSDGSVKDFAETQKNLNNQLASARASMSAMAITLGSALIPKVSAALGFFKEHSTTLKVVAGVIGGIVLLMAGYAAGMKIAAAAQAIMAAATLISSGAMWEFDAAADANPIGAVVLAIEACIVALIAIGAGIVYAYKHFKWFHDGVDAVWSGVKAGAEWLWHALGVVWGGIKAGVSAAVSGITAAWDWLTNAFDATVSWFQALPGRLLAGIKALPGKLGDLLKTAALAGAYALGYGLGLIVKEAMALPGQIWAGLKALPGLIGGLFVSMWHLAVAAVTSLWHGAVSVATSLYHDLIKWGKAAVDGTVKFFSELPGKIMAFISALPGKVKSAVSDAGTWLLQAGKDVVMGLVHGVGNMGSAAIDAVKALGHNMIQGFKDAIQSKSPSKKFAEIARWIPAGIAVGLEQGRSKAIVEMQRLGAQITKTGNQWAINLVKTTGTTLIQLGTKYDALVTRMKGAKAALASLVADSAKLAADTSSAIVSTGNITNVDAASGRTDEQQADVDKANKASVAAQKAALAADKTAAAAALSAQHALERFNLSKKTASDVLTLKFAQDAAAAAAAKAAAARQEADAANATAAQTSSATGGDAAAEMIANLHKSITAAQQFGQALEQLKKEGLDATSLQQLAAAGPEKGLATANALLEGGKEAVTQVAQLQKQLALTATASGKQVADATYASGIAAAQGLVKGLQSQEAAVLAQITKMSTAMVTAIKKALKIKSPSGVFADEVGAMIPAGIAQGITGGMSDVHAALAGVPITSGLSVGGIPTVGGTTPQSQSIVLELTVPVVVDGKVIQTQVQTQTLRSNFRNNTNGLALPRGR